MHIRRRLELIIERKALPRASKVLEQAGLKGYTAISAIAGFGQGDHWQRDTDLSSSRDMVVVISIGEADVIDAALEQLQHLLDQHIGLLSVSDVQIMRPQRF